MKTYCEVKGDFEESCFAFIVYIAMISYNIITGDTLTKVFMRIQGGELVIITSFWRNTPLFGNRLILQLPES